MPRAELGGAYQYIENCARAKDDEELLREVMPVTGRMDAAAKRILDEAEAARASRLLQQVVAIPGR